MYQFQNQSRRNPELTDLTWLDLIKQFLTYIQDLSDPDQFVGNSLLGVLDLARPLKPRLQTYGFGQAKSGAQLAKK